MIDAARSAMAVPPPLDLIFPTDAPPEGLEGVSLMPGHLRLERGVHVALPGYDLAPALRVGAIAAQVESAVGLLLARAAPSCPSKPSIAAGSSLRLCDTAA